MNFTLRHRVTEGVVAAAPVVAVLLAFSLLLTLLRQSRTQAVAPAGPAPLDLPALPAAVSAPPIALPAAPVAPVAPATAPAEGMPAVGTIPMPEVVPGPASCQCPTWRRPARIPSSPRRRVHLRGSARGRHRSSRHRCRRTPRPS